MSLYTSTNLYDIRPEWYFRFISKEKSEFLMNKLEKLGYSLKNNPVLPPPAPYITYQCYQYLYNQSYDTHSKGLMKFEIAADMYLNKRVNHLLDKYVLRGEKVLCNPEEQDMYFRFCDTLGNLNQKMQSKAYDKSKIDKTFGSENPYEEKFNNMAVLPSRSYIENTCGFDAYFTNINDKYVLANSAFTPLDGLYSSIENLVNSVVKACNLKWDKALNHLLKTVEDVLSIPSYFFGYLKDSVLIGIGQYENVNRDPTARFWVNLATKVVEEVVMTYVTAGIGNAVKAADKSLKLAKTSAEVAKAKMRLNNLKNIQTFIGGADNFSDMAKDGFTLGKFARYTSGKVIGSIKVDLEDDFLANMGNSAINLLESLPLESLDLIAGYPRTITSKIIPELKVNHPNLFNRNKGKYNYLAKEPGVNPLNIDYDDLVRRGMMNLTPKKRRTSKYGRYCWEKDIDILTNLHSKIGNYIKYTSNDIVNTVAKSIRDVTFDSYKDLSNMKEHHEEEGLVYAKSLQYHTPNDQFEPENWSVEGMNKSLRVQQPHLFKTPPVKVDISGDFRQGILSQNILLSQICE